MFLSEEQYKECTCREYRPRGYRWVDFCVSTTWDLGQKNRGQSPCS